VRIRTACSTLNTKILPSPILPVLAALLNVLRAAVQLGVPLLPTEPLHLGDGDPLHADLRQGFTHVIELEGLDDCHNHFHGWSS